MTCECRGSDNESNMPGARTPGIDRLSERQSGGSSLAESKSNTIVHILCVGPLARTLLRLTS
ncbi:MAG: hypothetical protein ACRD47_17600, partial [Nitrososphaeraceae archaeon]